MGEMVKVFRIHTENGSRLGGVHLELTGTRTRPRSTPHFESHLTPLPHAPVVFRRRRRYRVHGWLCGTQPDQPVHQLPELLRPAPQLHAEPRHGLLHRQRGEEQPHKLQTVINTFLFNLKHVSFSFRFVVLFCFVLKLASLFLCVSCEQGRSGQGALCVPPGGFVECTTSTTMARQGLPHPPRTECRSRQGPPLLASTSTGSTYAGTCTASTRMPPPFRARTTRPSCETAAFSTSSGASCSSTPRPAQAGQGPQPPRP